MNEEYLTNMKDEALIQRFKDMLHTLLKDVKSEAPEGSPERVEGDAHLEVLREFLAPFIVTWQGSELPKNIWELMKPHMLKDLSGQLEIQNQLEKTYSAPLKGNPATIAQTMGLLNVKNPNTLTILGNKVSQKLNPDQNILVVKTLGRL